MPIWMGQRRRGGVALGAMIVGAAGLAWGAPIVTPQTASYDFADAIAGMPADFTYSGNTGSVGVVQNLAGNYSSFTSGAPRLRSRRGMHIAPAVTNLNPNPRMQTAANATPTITSFTAGGNIALGANPITITNGSRFFNVAHTAHGQVVGTRFGFSGSAAVGNVAANAINVGGAAGSLAFNIVQVVDANNYMGYFYGPTVPSSGVTGGGAAVTVNYAPAVAGTVIAGVSRDTSVSTMAIRMITSAIADGVQQYERGFEFIGYGTDSLIFCTTGVGSVVQNDVVTFTLPLNGLFRTADYFLPAQNGATFFLVIEELDAAGSPLRENTLDITSTLPGSAQIPLSITATMQHASCSRVRAKFKVVATTAPGVDFRCNFYESIIAKIGYETEPVLPLANTQVASTRVDDDLTLSTLPFAIAAKGRLSVEIDQRVVVAATECIWSLGPLKLNVTGTGATRNLVLTDGTNTVTLPNVIDRPYINMGFFSIVAEWGPSLLRLAVATFSSSASDQVAAYANNAGSVLKIGRNAADGERGELWIKFVGLSDQNSASAAACENLAKPYQKFKDATGWQMPSVDYPVGHTASAFVDGSCVGSPVDVTAAFTPAGAGNLARVGAYSSGGNTGVIRKTGAGNIFADISTKVINFNGVIGDVLFENLDLRGWTITQAWATNGTFLTFRKCRFDHSSVSTVANNFIIRINYADGSGSAPSAPAIIEYCTFDSNLAPFGTTSTNFLAAIQFLNNDSTFRYNDVRGFASDGIKHRGIKMQYNRIVSDLSRWNSHSDSISYDGPSLQPIIITDNFIDARDKVGTQLRATSCTNLGIAAQGAGPTSHPATVERNMTLGSSTQVGYINGTPNTAAPTNPALSQLYGMRHGPATGAVSTSGLDATYPGITGSTYRNNRLDMAFVADLNFRTGSSLRLTDPGGNPITITLGSGGILAAMRIGLEQGTHASPYRGCLLTRDDKVVTGTTAPSITSANPAISSTFVAGAGNIVNTLCSRLAAVPGGSGGFVANNSFTINGQTFTAVAAPGATGNNQFNVSTTTLTSDTLGTLMSKIAAATGLIVTLEHNDIDISGNASVFRETPVTYTPSFP